MLTLPALPGNMLPRRLCSWVSDDFPGFEGLPGGPGVCFSCGKMHFWFFQKRLCTSFIKLHLLVCACTFYHLWRTEDSMQELVASRKLKSLGFVASTFALTFIVVSTSVYPKCRRPCVWDELNVASSGLLSLTCVFPPRHAKAGSCECSETCWLWVSLAYFPCMAFDSVVWFLPVWHQGHFSLELLCLLQVRFSCWLSGASTTQNIPWIGLTALLQSFTYSLCFQAHSCKKVVPLTWVYLLLGIWSWGAKCLSQGGGGSLQTMQVWTDFPGV